MNNKLFKYYVNRAIQSIKEYADRRMIFMDIDNLDYLENICEEHVERLYNRAFLRKTRYLQDGTPYDITVAVDPDFKYIYESYKDLFKYLKAIREEISKK